MRAVDHKAHEKPHRFGLLPRRRRNPQPDPPPYAAGDGSVRILRSADDVVAAMDRAARDAETLAMNARHRAERYVRILEEPAAPTPIRHTSPSDYTTGVWVLRTADELRQALGRAATFESEQAETLGRRRESRSA